MNNYYTLYHLVSDFNQRFEGFYFAGAWSGVKKTIQLLFEKQGMQKTLYFQATSDAVLFAMDGGMTKKSNSISFFDTLIGKEALIWHLSEADRILTIQFDSTLALRFYLFGPKANVIYMQDGQRIASFRQGAVPDVLPDASNRPVTVAALEKLISDGTLKTVQQCILALDPRFPRNLIPGLVAHHGLNLKEVHPLVNLIQASKESLLLHPVYRSRSDGSLCLLNETFVPIHGDQIFSDVNALVRHSWLESEIKSKFRAQQEFWKNRLRAQLERIRAVILELSDDQKAIQRANLYEKYGHILMANSHLKKAETDLFTTIDIFNPDKKVSMTIKKDLSISENAQLYYEKARHTRQAIDVNQHRKTDYQKKLHTLHSLLSSFDAVDGPRSLDRWIKSNMEDLNRVVPQTGSISPLNSNKPWRILHTEGYEIWIGKSASGNDVLTQTAHKEDIWMHARGVSGSHVVIRMNKSIEVPPLSVMETAAAWAAWFSKAKTSSLVPVSATKRKYVRKPKGADPGTVIIEKEKVLLVKPEKPGSLTE